MASPLLEASVRVSRERAALAEDLMLGQGALSVTLSDEGDVPILEPGVGETPLWPRVRVTGLFSGDEDDGVSLSRALALHPEVGDPGLVRLAPVADQAWERAWLEDFRPLRFGRRLWIVPTGRTCPDPGAVELRLDPGLAFGTGTHPTTRLALEWLERQPLGGRSVLDFGCGSGVLGIAAALLGADEVRCIDHDPQAIAATRENARRNGVQDRLLAEPGRRPSGAPAQVVVANILAGVLIDLAAPVQAAVATGGSLALTGILDHQADAVAAAYAGRFPRLDRATIDGWTLLHGVAGAA